MEEDGIFLENVEIIKATPNRKELSNLKGRLELIITFCYDKFKLSFSNLRKVFYFFWIKWF